MMKAVLTCLRQCVEGFEELSQEDQILLIKHGSFPVILTRYTNLVSEKTLFLPLMAFRVPRYYSLVSSLAVKLPWYSWGYF